MGLILRTWRECFSELCKFVSKLQRKINGMWLESDYSLLPGTIGMSPPTMLACPIVLSIEARFMAEHNIALSNRVIEEIVMFT